MEEGFLEVLGLREPGNPGAGGTIDDITTKVFL